MNALMLALALRLAGWRIKPGCVLLGALAGAMIAQATDGVPKGVAMLLWLPTAFVMMRIAAGKRSMRRMITGTALLLCAAGLVGGMVLALWGATGSMRAAYALGILAALGIGVYTAYIGCDTVETANVRVLCLCRGTPAAFDAMIDSGNTLRDYLTHLPVIVIPERLAANALRLEALPLRPIFAQTAGGRQRMDLFVPDRIELELDGEHHAVCAAIAFSSEMSEDVPALVPAACIRGDWNSNRGG